MTSTQSLWELFTELLPFLQLISALVGGIIAVLIGQILSFYRDEISIARSFRYQVKHLIELLDEDIQTKCTSEKLESVHSELESLYVSNRWLLNEEGRRQFRELLTKLEVIIQEQEGGNKERVLQLCKKMDEKTAHVTKCGAVKRFQGKERPYKNHEESAD